MDLHQLVGAFVAAPIIPLQPKPFLGTTVTLPNATTVVELDPQPFTNTKEIIFLNLSATDNVLVQTANLAVVPASAAITLLNGSSGFPPLVGDTVTIGGVLLTAVVGVPVSGDDTFSAPAVATATITVNSSPLTVGDTITINGLANPSGLGLTLTGVLAPRVAGSSTFEVDGGSAAAIATSIATALTDATLLKKAGTASTGVNVVTVVAFQDSVSYTIPNTHFYTVVTAVPGDLTTAGFSGGADVEILASSPFSPLVHNLNVAWNIHVAINDALNGFTALVTSVFPSDLYFNPPSSFVLPLIAVPPGTAGNGIVLSVVNGAPPTGLRVGVTTPTAGGKDALPTAASVTASNSTVIPAGSAITYDVGSEGNRQPLADSTFWAAEPGSKLGVVLKAESGTAVEVNATLVQNRGYPDGV